MAAGKTSEACPKFEESYKLDPGSGTLINLAACYERAGRLASAWGTYQEAAAFATRDGNEARSRGARDLAAALAPKLSRLTLEVPPDSRVSGLVVTRDGVDVGEPQWGVPIPTDEGEHEIRATAPGHRAWRSTVLVKGPGKTVAATVPQLAVAAPGEAIAPGTGSAAQESGSASSTERTEPKSGGLGGQRVIALVVGGVGVAGLAVGSIFGLRAIAKQKEAHTTCDGSECTSQGGVDAGKDAYQAGTISTIGMVAGVAGLAGAATLWFTAPSREDKTAVGVGPGSILVRGTF